MIDRAKARKILVDDNPMATKEAIGLYLEAFMTYIEAAENLRKFDAVCAHPRTGAPIQNPYLIVRDVAQRQLQSLAKARIDADRLWEAV